MAFQSLYRKHRPQSFAELVGQEAVTTALRNAVREGRVGHAYLFSGPRGTGKTTTARLLAKALNCPNRTDEGEPCNACPSCLEIAAGTSMDVMELDAASNRGVSEMRSLLERVAYRSAGGANKVYIVDEVHMLTKEASTALLKTLEEPPGHVVFVLATTDPQMVAPTIRSRTQHFEFSLLGADRLASHLAEVARREGVEADTETLELLAARAGGSARDALSLLDQALAYGQGKLLADQVRTLLGGTPFGARSGILEALAAGDAAGLLERLEVLLAGGMDTRQLADDLLRHLRDVFLVASAGDRVRLEVSEEERAQLRAQAEAMGVAAAVRALESLGEAVLEIRRAPDPRLVLEVALLRQARRDVTTIEALADRMGRLERAVDDLRQSLHGVDPAASRPAVPRPARDAGGPRIALGALQGREEPIPPPKAAPPPPPAPEPPVETAAPAPPLVIDEVLLAWPKALTELKPRLKAMVKEAQPVRIEGDAVVLGLPGRFQKVHFPTLQAEAQTVSNALAKELGRPVRVKVVLDDSLASPDDRAAGDPPEEVAEELMEPQPPDALPGVDSPVGLVIEAFGATVESETVRE